MVCSGLAYVCWQIPRYRRASMFLCVTTITFGTDLIAVSTILVAISLMAVTLSFKFWRIRTLKPHSALGIDFAH